MIATLGAGLGAILASAMLLAGCVAAGAAPSPPVPRLGIANGTTLTVLLYVNEQRVATVGPRSGPPEIDADELPSLPWRAEARTETGRVLTSIDVREGDTWDKRGPDGIGETKGVFGRVDLSCGRLTIWAGPVVPSGPAPPESPGHEGDCLP